MGLREVKKELNELEKEQLIYHLTELYKKYPEVKEYLDFFSDPDEQKILEKFKERVHEGFYPSRGWRLKLGRSRKAINAFKKLGISPEAEADLLLYFTEVAVQFAREKRPGNESYYDRLEKSFEKALEHMEKHLILEDFKQRSQFIVERSEQFPWSCHSRLVQIFERFY